MATISAKNISIALFEATKDKQGKDLDVVLQQSVEFLARKQLLSKAAEILKNLQEILDNNEGILRITVESAHSLSKETVSDVKDQLKKRYNAKEVHLEEKVDKKYLGGMKIIIGNEIIDLTLRHKIDQLQNHLIAH